MEGHACKNTELSDTWQERSACYGVVTPGMLVTDWGQRSVESSGVKQSVKLWITGEEL